MKDNILKITAYFEKIFFALCIFAAPLVFLTDLTQNPFNIQSLLCALGVCGLLFLWGFKIFVKREAAFSFAIADILYLSFILICALSVAVGYFRPDGGFVILSEALRRGSLLVCVCAAAYFFAKSVKPYEGQEKDSNPPYFLFLWGFLWLLYPSLRSEGSFDFYACAVLLLGFFICVKHILNGGAKEFADVFITVGGLAASYGILQNFGCELFWRLNISVDFGKRAVSTFGNPNFLSSYLLLFLPLLFCFFISAKNSLAKFYYFALSLVYAAYLALAMTRSSWAGAVLAFAVLFAFADFRKFIGGARKKIILFAFIILAVFFAWPQQNGAYSSAAAARFAQIPLPSSFKNLTLDADPSALNQSYHQRLMMWTCGMRTLKKHPLLGGGWGSFQYEYGMCQGDLIKEHPALRSFVTQANSAHNELVEVLAQSGFLGFAFYLAFYAALIILLLHNLKIFNPAQRLFYGALFAGLCGVFADNMFNITMQTLNVAFAFWFVVGLIVSSAQKYKIVRVNVFAGAALSLLLLLAGAVWVTRESRVFLSDVYFLKGSFAYASKDYDLAKLRLQHAVEISSEKSESYYLLANTLLKLDQKQEAAKVCADALKRFPFYYEFHFLSFSVSGKAESLLETLHMNPAYKPAARALAGFMAERAVMRTPENIAFLKSIYGLYQDDGYFVNYYASALDSEGDYAPAAEALRTFLKTDAFDGAASSALQKIDLKLKNGNDSVLQYALKMESYRQLLKNPAALTKSTENELTALRNRDKRDFFAGMLLAEFYFRTAQYPKARGILEDLYKFRGDDISLNFAMASLDSAVGDNDGAAVYLRKILTLDRSNALASERLKKTEQLSN